MIACPATRDAVEEQEERGEVGCPICGRAAALHPDEEALPSRIVVGANGAYWRDYEGPADPEPIANETASGYARRRELVANARHAAHVDPCGPACRAAVGSEK